MTAYPPAFASRPKVPGIAVASLVLGILGVVLIACLWFFPILPILAIVFGHVSIGQVNRQVGAPGKGLAITGMVTGYVGLGLSLLILLLIFLGTITSATPTF